MDHNPQRRETHTESKPWSRETRRSFIAACLLVGCGLIGLLWCLGKAASVGNAAFGAVGPAAQSSQGVPGISGEMTAQISELETSQLWADIEELQPQESAEEEKPSSGRGQTGPSGSASSQPAPSSEGSQSNQEQDASSQESQSTQEYQSSSESQSSEASQSSSADSQGQDTEPAANEVWISVTGKRYHSKSSCSGMKNPVKMTLSEAAAQGYTPCKRCYRE